MKNNSERGFLFHHPTPEFVNYLYDMVVVQGWSIQYACSQFKGGLVRLRKFFPNKPEIECIYVYYMDRQRAKNKRHFKFTND